MDAYFFNGTFANTGYRAAKGLSNAGLITTLPDDQWIKELSNWVSSSWAGIQILVADHAIGPSVRDPDAKLNGLPPANEGEKALCGMQKMRKPGGFV